MFATNLGGRTYPCRRDGESYTPGVSGIYVQIVTLHPEESLVATASGELPQVAIENADHVDPAAQDLGPVIDSVREQLGLHIVPLRIEHHRNASQEFTLLISEARSEVLPGGFRWTSGAGEPFRKTVADVIDQQTATVTVEPPPPAWSRRGWHREAASWAIEAMEQNGNRARSDLDLVRVWGLSALGRVDGDKGLCWFKAMPVWYREELRALEDLAQVHGKNLPELIAVDHDRGWLLLSDAGPDLTTDPAMRRAAVFAFGSLQVDTSTALSKLLAAGWENRGLTRTAAGLDALFHVTSDLADLTSEERHRLGEIENVVDETLRSHLPLVPMTVMHGDFHFGNVRGTIDEPVFIDWSDACIGHPFVDLLFLRLYGSVDERDFAALLDVYLSAWSDVASLPALRKEASTMLTLGHLHIAESYRRIQMNQAAESRLELDGFLAHHLREFLRLWDAEP
jgi:aminoglycoside/choline kinase family phosphotransferase